MPRSLLDDVLICTARESGFVNVVTDDMFTISAALAALAAEALALLSASVALPVASPA